MKNLFLSFILLFVAACGNNNNFLYVTATDEDTLKLMKKMVPDFNGAIGCEHWSIDRQMINLSKDTIIDRRFIEINHSTKALKQCADGNDKAWGCYDGYTNEISFIEGLDYETFKAGIEVVLLHELGHSMGLVHEKDTVMNERYYFMPYDMAMQSLVSLINKHHKNQCYQIQEEK